MKHYSIGQFAKEIGVTVQTLRNWDKTGKLKPASTSSSGHRHYSQQQLDYFLGLHKPDSAQRITIGYCRVSSNKRKDDLDRQIEKMKEYLARQGKPFEIIKDIGSGINYNKKGLNKMIDMVLNYNVDSIVVLHKDRLLRFGYELLESIFLKYGTKIEIIDNTPKSEDQELVEDLIQIVTVFSCNLQDKRANKAKKMIKELKDSDNGEEG
ncbi:IS607 family transposase [Domibacillus enclensis]|uniref:IS607 family transposase n=1 Tax=Domibacillus enclensis TaxID=1017273 RepID=A0A1N7BCX2_9BACI|nr:IS607 family transposase [Domibacillus enclensis]OXS74681.1 IS607 family transposase [Domibacillus enclensis]SIR49211.1 Predicted site-specific integrase-resolvase [Domibacillus enclensis]